MKDLPIPDLLEQGENWFSVHDGHVRTIPLTEMSTLYLASVRGWLLKAAPGWHQAAVLGFKDALQAAGDEGLDTALYRDIELPRMEALTPEAWMEEQVLFAAITRILKERTASG